MLKYKTIKYMFNYIKYIQNKHTETLGKHKVPLFFVLQYSDSGDLTGNVMWKPAYLHEYSKLKT